MGELEKPPDGTVKTVDEPSGKGTVTTSGLEPEEGPEPDPLPEPAAGVVEGLP